MLTSCDDDQIGGWDISSMPLDQAMRRAKVMDFDLQRQVAPHMSTLHPLPSIYYPTFINANQEERANNILPGADKAVHLEKIRSDIREFKAANGLDHVVVLWTANTERYSELIPGVNDTADNLLAAVKSSHSEVSPSTIFAMAAILEGSPYINGAPQNTFVPGCIELAERQGSFIGGDDFKSGQTKIKSVLADFLVNAGIKPLSIACSSLLSYMPGTVLTPSYSLQPLGKQRRTQLVGSRPVPLQGDLQVVRRRRHGRCQPPPLQGSPRGCLCQGRQEAY